MSESQPVTSMQPSSADIAKTIAPPAENSVPVPEAKPEEKKSEEQDYSSRYAALSRREKLLVDKERKLKEMESKYKDKDSNFQSWEEKKAKFKQNPDSIFDEVGMSFDELINYKLGLATKEEQASNDPDAMYKKLKAELLTEVEQKEKAKLEQEQKTRQEQEEKENVQIIENFKSELVDAIKKNTDKYELINYQGNYDLVFDVIQQYYDEHEEVLPIDQAADHVESYLESLVEGATKLKKFQTKFAPKAESTQTPESAPKTNPAQDNAPKTLSNSLNSQNSSFNREPISIEESKRRAAQLLRWSNT